MKDESLLLQYGISAKNPSNEIKVVLLKEAVPCLKIAIDFTFNIIKQVKKVEWDEEAPIFWEVRDGLSLFSYCINPDCKIHKEMFVSNIGYIKLTADEFSYVMKSIICPCCWDTTYPPLILNIGFVNSKWEIEGILKKSPSTWVFTDGKTYDSKLHTFKEMDYRNDWKKLWIKTE
jgi:hypothetical protein